MRAHLYIIVIYTTILCTTSYTNIGDDEKFSIYGKRNLNEINNENVDKHFKYHGKIIQDLKDAKIAKIKAEVLKRSKNYEKPLNMVDDIGKVVKNPDSEKYHRDPVLNYMKRSNLRRARRDSSDFETSDTSSSSLELPNWKDEWKQHWLQKKLEAINSSMPKGDMVNMVAARPWGVPCGDPNQHDAPWGTCMLPMECEAEYRIYRGDYFCGRTKFICCALQVTNYDLYGGFDVSFADSSLETDSEEKKNRDRGSKERKRRKRAKERRQRLRDRLKRKRKIKRTIRKITREIRKILNRSFRNGTTARKKKTKQLKKFIKELKHRYMKERKTVKDIHEMELIKIDAALQKRLNEIRGLNQEYVKNQTFRDVIINGSISRHNMNMLMKAHPELANVLNTRRSGNVRSPQDYLEYDIEYGYLYY
ncbi:uncharacterized protein LOC120632240 [Pararge aegeria]|uniref:Jg26994 protein n=1 Tax=Pararge aegeria aegeria TaxID=348720 RepID=A0A8S4RTR9_9NEOP|nr:uncharacterized protein LOC120632240 [Pararge aegeria]CAH2241697.1 jg26994 [Pararge aegeria aegeria]